MKNYFHPVFALLAALGRAFGLMLLLRLPLTVAPVEAAQVWSGSLTGFAVAAGADWTQATNQDRLTANVWLARSTTRGLFNAASENGYASYYSPSNTAWASGLLADYASLTYASWEAWNGHNPPAMVGQDAVLHLLRDDVYLSINFSFWGGAGGGFAYTRSTPALTPEPGVPALVMTGLLILLGRRWRRGRLRLQRG